MEAKILLNIVANYGSLWRGCWVKYYSLQEAGQVNLLFTTIKHSLTQMWLLFPLKFVSATLFLIGTVCWEWLCVWSTISVRVTGFHCMQAVGCHSGVLESSFWPGDGQGRNRGMEYIQCTVNLVKMTMHLKSSHLPLFYTLCQYKEWNGTWEARGEWVFLRQHKKWHALKNKCCDLESYTDSLARKKERPHWWLR